MPSEGASVSGVYHPLLAVGGTAPEAHPPQRRDLGSDRNPSSFFQKIRRRWESFVTSFPNVTLSRSASPQPPLGTTS